METIQIFDDLYMFNSYNEHVNLTFNQFLLLGAEPILFHTGNVQQAAVLAPKVKLLLKDLPLKYIFVSHFESDECGGMDVLLKQFPEAKVICSAITARQFAGFGFAYDLIIKAPGEYLEGTNFKVQFISYPSEMHLWEGLLALETQRQILFSADLFIRYGKVEEFVVGASWQEELENIAPAQVPNPSARENLQQFLAEVPVSFVAAGHGPVLKL